MKNILSGAQMCAFFFAATNSIFAQGSLTPPAPPAPTMKTLDQVESRTLIDHVPYTIGAAGSYYLTKNLNGIAGDNGITITADDVTLDLNGFALIGVSGSLYGVATGTVKNIVIRNGVVRNWGQNGVDASTATNSQFEKLRLSSNSMRGLYVGKSSTVIGCTAQSNTTGGITTQAYCVIKDCTALSNSGIGISAGNGAVITNCTSTSNAGDGIDAGDDSTISACVAGSNASAGIRVTNGANITGCTASSNGASNSSDGINVGNNSSVSNCNASNNGGNGIAAVSSARSPAALSLSTLSAALMSATMR